MGNREIFLGNLERWGDYACVFVLFSQQARVFVRFHVRGKFMTKRINQVEPTRQTS